MNGGRGQHCGEREGDGREAHQQSW
jgi:hypothetical protein